MVTAILGILIGLVSGTMAGAFGVGGAIVSTPAVQVILGAPAFVAVGTPLPVIFPTTVTGVQAYRRAGQIDWRAVSWTAPPGAAAAGAGAYVTKFLNPSGLLLATAVLIGWQAYRVGTARSTTERAEQASQPSGIALAATGLVAGFASGLLGIGGGVILVPVMAGVLGMPLKRTLGTSLVIITFMVIPGTIVHARLHHINWVIFLWLTLGVIPGAALGSRWTIRAKERTLRFAVSVFLSIVAILYAALEIHDLVKGIRR